MLINSNLPKTIDKQEQKCYNIYSKGVIYMQIYQTFLTQEEMQKIIDMLNNLEWLTSTEEHLLEKIKKMLDNNNSIML